MTVEGANDAELAPIDTGRGGESSEAVTDREDDPRPVDAPSDRVVENPATQAVLWERIDWVACGVLVLVSVVLVGLHVRAYSTLSPIDELQHIDYTIKAGNFEVPHQNDLVGFDAMSEAACRSVDAPSYIGPLCGLDEYDPEDFQENGVNTAASQYPFYYTATGLASRAIVATGVVGSQVTAARMVGAFWAGMAWSVMWYLLAMVRVPRGNRVIVIALLIATPLTLFHAATVNPDAILMLTGSLALLATLKYESGRLHWAFLIVVYLAMFFVEATNILVIAACAGYLAIRAWTRPGQSTWSRALPLLVFPMLFLLRMRVGRPLLRVFFPPSPRTSSSTMFQDNAIDGINWTRVAEQLDANFLPITRAYLPPLLRTEYTFSFIQLTNWLLIALMFVAAIGLIPSERPVWLSRVAMPTLLISGPFYTFSFAYFSEADFPAPGRFALPLIAFIVVTAASALTTRAAVVVASVIAVGSVLNTVGLLLTA